MSIVAQAQKRSRLVLAVLSFLLAFGFFALVTIPKEASPDIQIPTMYVVAPLPGVSPTDAVSLLVKPLEQQLRAVQGVKAIKSSGFLGGGNVQIEFKAGLILKKHCLTCVRPSARPRQNFRPMR